MQIAKKVRLSMKGVKFGNYHSYDDFSLILSQKRIGTPSPKTDVIDIPGGDGTAECIGMIDVSSADVTIALGGWYRCPNLYDVADYPYPVSFSEIPTVEMMFQTTNSTAALLWTFSSNEANAKLYLPQCYLIRPVTGSNCNGKINIIVKGKF